MSTDDQQRVTCPECGKGYRWDTKLIGRAVACRQCEVRFEVPIAPGKPGTRLDAPASEDGIYELDLSEDQRHPDAPLPMAVPAVEGKCPACNSPIKETAVVCLNCGFNLREGEKIQTHVVAVPDEPEHGSAAHASPGRAAPAPGPATSTAAALTARRKVNQDELAEEAARQHRFIDYKLPAILLGVGVVIALLNIFVLAPQSPTLTGPNTGNLTTSQVIIFESIRSTGSFVLNAALVFSGLLILVYLFGAGFGDVFSVLLKIAAIVMIVEQVVSAVFLSFDIASGGYGSFAILFNWFIYLGLMCTMCIKLLDLDITELRVLIVFIIVGRIATRYGIAALVMMLF